MSEKTYRELELAKVEAELALLHRRVENMREGVVLADPQLIQGYTAEQWQEIIDGGYLCEFNDNKDFNNSPYGLLTCLEPFRDQDGLQYNQCRPAQIKGVMRPIFVEPVDDPYCVFFDIDGKALHSGMMRWKFRMENPGYSGDACKATKYIEL